MSVQEVRVCDVTRKIGAKRYTLMVVECEAGGTVDATIDATIEEAIAVGNGRYRWRQNVDLCDQAIKRLKRSIERGLTPPKKREATQ